MTTPLVPGTPIETPDHPRGPTTRPRRVTGALLVGSGVLAAIGSTVLATVFDWPDVLDLPGSQVLPLFAADQQAIRAGFYLMLLSSALLVPAAFGVEAALTRGGPAARAMTAMGVAGALFQVLGWVRWPITVPYLAEDYAAATDPATRQAIATSFDLANRYGGGAVGEHLGWLFQGTWAVFVGIVVLRAAGLPRVVGATGLALAGLWAVLVPASAALPAESLAAVGLPVYTAWYVWLLGLGALLALRRVGPAPDPAG